MTVNSRMASRRTTPLRSSQNFSGRRTTSSSRSIGRLSNQPFTTQSRKSSIGGPTIKKDPRSSSDKQLIGKCLSDIVQYLKKTEFPYAIPKLSSPSNKDFCNIFQHIRLSMNRSYKPGARIEDDFLEILQLLGYPFAISRSSLLTVGAPHTWPNIVLALHWLTECAGIHQSEISAESNNTIRDESKVVKEVVYRGYGNFMSGECEGEDVDAELAELVASEQKQIEVDVLKVEDEENDLDMVIQGFRGAKDPLHVIKIEIEERQQQENELKAFFVEIQGKGDLLQASTDSIKEQLKLAKEKLESVREEGGKVKRLVEQQVNASFDYRRKAQVMDTTRKQVESVRIDVEKMKERLDFAGIKIGKITDKIISLKQRVNDQLRVVGLVPSNAELADGRDLEIGTLIIHQPGEMRATVDSLQEIRKAIQDDRQQLCSKLEEDLRLEQDGLVELSEASESVTGQLEAAKQANDQAHIQLEQLMQENTARRETLERQILKQKEKKKLNEDDIKHEFEDLAANSISATEKLSELTQEFAQLEDEVKMTLGAAIELRSNWDKKLGELKSLILSCTFDHKQLRKKTGLEADS